MLGFNKMPMPETAPLHANLFLIAPQNKIKKLMKTMVIVLFLWDLTSCIWIEMLHLP